MYITEKERRTLENVKKYGHARGYYRDVLFDLALKELEEAEKAKKADISSITK